MFRIDVPPGEDVGPCIERQLQSHTVGDAGLFGLGALDSGTLSAMDTIGQDQSFDLDQAVEVVVTGDVRDGALHMHMTAGRAWRPTQCGHFVSGIAGEKFILFIYPLTS